MAMYDPRLQKQKRQKLLPAPHHNEIMQFVLAGGLLLVIAGVIIGFLS